MTMALQYAMETGALVGADQCDLTARYGQYDRIRQIERASIRAFLEKHRQYLKGRVLDFGAGEQPYRDLVEGEYVPFEKGQDIQAGPFDAVLCTQVVQYLDDVSTFLRWGARAALKPGGHLVMTYPTNWDEVESGDFWRLTRMGMALLLHDTHFTVEVHERRAEVALGNFKFPLGYGVIARK